MAIARLGDKRQIVITEHTCKARYWNTTVCWGYWASKAPLLCWVRYQPAQLGHADGVSELKGGAPATGTVGCWHCPAGTTTTVHRPSLPPATKREACFFSFCQKRHTRTGNITRQALSLHCHRQCLQGTRVSTTKHPVYFRRKFPAYY